MKTAKLIQKLLFFSLIAFTITSCDMAASKATPTPLPTATATTVPTKTPLPTATATLTITPWPTATPNATATAQYNEMSDVVSGLYDDGYLPSTDGRFTLLDDFSEQWAQLGWYQWTNTGWKPSDFVMTAHMAWKSDTKTPNPSGCGIVFRALPTYEHYVVFVYSIGYIRFGIKTDQFRGQHADYFGPSQNEGEVDFMLTAVGSKFDVFINGKHIKQYIGFDGKMTSGDLAYTVLSGTNAGFGTECTITNAKLWMVK